MIWSVVIRWFKGWQVHKCWFYFDLNGEIMLLIQFIFKKKRTIRYSICQLILKMYLVDEQNKTTTNSNETAIVADHLMKPIVFSYKIIMFCHFQWKWTATQLLAMNQFFVWVYESEWVNCDENLIYNLEMQLFLFYEKPFTRKHTEFEIVVYLLITLQNSVQSD